MALVVIAEDDDIRTIMTRILRRAGHTPTPTLTVCRSFWSAVASCPATPRRDEAGATATLAKPFLPAALLETLNTTLTTGHQP